MTWHFEVNHYVYQSCVAAAVTVWGGEGRRRGVEGRGRRRRRRGTHKQGNAGEETKAERRPMRGNKLRSMGRPNSSWWLPAAENGGRGECVHTRIEGSRGA